MPNNTRKPMIASAALVAATLVFTPAVAEKTTPAQGSDAKDELAQNFLAEHEIGRRFHIDPADLPPPKTGPIVTGPVVDRAL